MDYAHFVKETEKLYLTMLSSERKGTAKKAGVPPLGAKPAGSGPGGQIVVLIVAPHPDDECLMGSYAFRMKLEWGARVVVFPFSLGSRPDRQQLRLQELRAACKVLEFELSTERDLTEAVANLDPDFIFSPHAEDGHPTHMRASAATLTAMNAALDRKPEKIFHWLQTEYWLSMKSPNLLIPLSAEHVTMIGLALRQHEGEVSRNPYHLRLPAWYMEQVRRGSEQIAGMGSMGQAEWVFGQLFQRVEYSRA